MATMAVLGHGSRNDIAVGLIGVVAGLGMFYWAISTDKSIRLNRIPQVT
ncbi:MAG: hypothetical protein DQL93_0050 (endogenous virus) [Lactobacillus phage ViSo-2018b]|nr:MAG: hypothetical protein DQL93_0050 [Lactobacillus phage ViSo-2018b]